MYAFVFLFVNTTSHNCRVAMEVDVGVEAAAATRTEDNSGEVAAVVEHGHKEEVVAAAALGVEPLLPEVGAAQPATTQDIKLEEQLTGATQQQLVDMVLEVKQVKTFIF